MDAAEVFQKHHQITRLYKVFLSFSEQNGNRFVARPTLELKLNPNL